jgi:hypothetical protein
MEILRLAGRFEDDSMNRAAFDKIRQALRQIDRPSSFAFAAAVLRAWNKQPHIGYFHGEKAPCPLFPSPDALDDPASIEDHSGH